jgi:hypothetical protein
MKIFGAKLTLVWMSFIVFSLVFAGISDAKLDPKTVEGLWLFNDAKGKIAKDSSENAHDGEIAGAKWVDGKFGKALEFDGTDNQVVIKNYFGVGGKEPRTTVLWWKANDTRDHSWVKWGVNVNTQKYYVRAHPDGENCYLRIEVAGGQHYGSTNVCDGEWHHLAVVFPKGSDSVKDHLLYVDGALEEQTAGGDIGMDTETKTTEVHIGAPLAHHTFANGIMDEIAIFNVDLTENDINAIMTGGFKASFAVEHNDKLTTTWSTIKTQY